MLEEIKNKMREIFSESAPTDIESWWDDLDYDDRKTVLRGMGFGNSDNIKYELLSPSTKSEIQAYFEKHKGRIR